MKPEEKEIKDLKRLLGITWEIIWYHRLNPEPMLQLQVNEALKRKVKNRKAKP